MEKDSINTVIKMTSIKKQTLGRVKILSLNSANPYNPISLEILIELKKELQDDEKIIVINGENKAFSAGADISGFQGLIPKDAFRLSQLGHEIMDLICKRGMPVIAAIHGFALGGGLELALACDVRICHPNSTFGLPEVTLGILPGFGGTQRLKSLVGEGRAMYLISTGTKFNADSALSWGVVNEITENYLEKSIELAKDYEKLPVEALSNIKNLIRNNDRTKLDLETEYFANLFSTENQKEGIDAFLKKRKPNFNQKISKTRN